MTFRGVSARIALCCLAAVACTAFGCEIPVHLWALERWAPDSYPVLVFREGEVSPAQQSMLDRLKAGAAGANVVVTEVDVSETLDEYTRAIWESQDQPSLPWMVLRHPMPVPPAVRIWSGPLDDAAVDVLIDSPKRREVAKHLVDADAVVWVLLDGDDATASDLAGMLDDVRKNPPVATPTPGAPTSDKTFPLPRFPVVRMSRTDPGEGVFAQMLLGVEADLGAYTEPMAFPVFGRGRALYALVGAGINPQMVRNACAFLVNGCSCQVKEQNPGMDLLLAVDWNRRLGGIRTDDATAAPPLPGVPSLARTSGEAMPEAVPASGGVLRNLIAALAVGVLVVASSSVALWKRRGAKFYG